MNFEGVIKMAWEPRRFTDEEIRRANSVSVLELAKKYYPEINERADKKAFIAKGSGGLSIFKDGRNRWYNFSAQIGGSAIDFIRHHENVDFVTATKMLLGEHYSQISQMNDWDKSPDKKQIHELMLPKHHSDNKQVFWYLVECRGLEPKIVSDMLFKNKLYQSSVFNIETDKFEFACTFVGYNDKFKAVYCSLRGAYPESNLKRDQRGSSKKIPFAMNGSSQKLYVFESPIDVMSHASMFYLEGYDWKADHRISTGTLSDEALRWYLDKHPEIKEITWCYDNDKENTIIKPFSQAEYEAAQRMGDNSFYMSPIGTPMKAIPYNHGQEAAIKYAEIYKEMGYNVSIETPKLKDVNEDLINLRQQINKIAEDVKKTLIEALLEEDEAEY